MPELATFCEVFAAAVLSLPLDKHLRRLSVVLVSLLLEPSQAPFCRKSSPFNLSVWKSTDLTSDPALWPS